MYTILVITLCADGDNGRLIYASTFLLFIVSLIINRKISREKLLQHTNIWYFLFVLFAALSMFWSIGRNDSFGMVKLLIRQFLVVFSLGMCINNLKDIYTSLKIYLIACTIMMLKLTFYMANGYSGSKMWDAVCGNYFNTVAQILAIAIVIAYFFMQRARTESVKILYVFFILFSFYHIFVTGSRKGLMMPFFEIGIFMILQSGADAKKILRNFLVSFCLAGIILYFLAQNEVFYSRLKMIFILIFEGDTMDESSVLRVAFIQLAKQMFIENPIIGCGINTFASQCLIHLGRYIYSHNNFFELLSGTGVIGFALYYWLYIYSVIKLYILKTKNNIYILGFSIWFTLMMFEYGIVTYSILLYPIILTILAVSYRADILKKGENNVSRI